MNSKTHRERFLVVGGCAAGMSAASKAKRLNPSLEVIAFEKTAHVSYSACGIPYYVADFVRKASDLITITPQEFQEKRGIEVLTKHEVVDIKPVYIVLPFAKLEASITTLLDQSFKQKT